MYLQSFNFFKPYYVAKKSVQLSCLDLLKRHGCVKLKWHDLLHLTNKFEPGYIQRTNKKSPTVKIGIVSQNKRFSIVRDKQK